MELRQLRYFVKAAELLNFTEASRVCFVTQGTLSQQLKQLEIDLDTVLFDRIGNRVQLTDAGKLFLPYARLTLQNAESGQNVLDDYKELKTGELHIGATYALASRLTAAIIVFSEKYPDVKVFVEFGTSEGLLQKLKEGHLDFILSFSQAGKSDNIQSVRLFESPLVLIVSETHPWAEMEEVNVRQLSMLPLALPSQGFSTRSHIDHVFAELQFKPNTKIEMNDIGALLELVKTGRWATILTLAAAGKQKKLRSIPFGSKEMSRQATLSWPKDVYRKKASIIFTELLLKQ